MSKKIGNKIDWSFDVKVIEDENVNDLAGKPEVDKGGVKKVSDMIHLIGAKDLEQIVFKNQTGGVVGNFTSMNLFKEGTAESDTVKHVKEQLKINVEICTVQLIA